MKITFKSLLLFVIFTFLASFVKGQSVDEIWKKAKTLYDGLI